MTRCLIVCVVLLALAVFGCKPSEETKTTGTEPEKASQKMEQTSQSAAEEAKETATAAVDETREAVETAVEETGQKAREVAEASKETMTEAAEAVSAAATPPESLVFEASYGNITFPHGMHAESYDCATCHGDGTPEAFGLDKDKAHELCKGCHEDEGAGPTSCRDCHEK